MLGNYIVCLSKHKLWNSTTIKSQTQKFETARQRWLFPRNSYFKRKCWDQRERAVGQIEKKNENCEPDRIETSDRNGRFKPGPSPPLPISSICRARAGPVALSFSVPATGLSLRCTATNKSDHCLTSRPRWIIWSGLDGQITHSITQLTAAHTHQMDEVWRQAHAELG